jgi:hypothetical protein
MSIDAETVLALNRAGPNLPIGPERAQELAEELARFKAAADAARAYAEFDLDPHDFRNALQEVGGDGA